MGKQLSMLFICLSMLFLLAVSDSSDASNYNEAETEDSVANVDKYFGAKTGPITREEAMDVLLATYVETNLKEVQDLEMRVSEEDKLSEMEEEQLYVKIHMDDFFEERYKDTELTTEKLKDIIRQHEFLAYLEEKMKEAEEKNLKGENMDDMEVDEDDEDDDDDAEEEDDIEGTSDV